MMNPVFFSILIPTYNRPESLMKALETVFKQTFKDFEVIIVDDGSDADYTSVKEKISSLPNSSFMRIPNAGVSAARNYGISKARGKFICFLDDDDEYLENHLAVLYGNIREKDFQSGIYKTLPMTSNGKELKRIGYRKMSESSRPIEMVFANMMVSCGVAVSADILKSYKFNTEIPLSEDYELWARIALKYPVFYIYEYTTVYHFHDDNRSASAAHAIEVNKKHIAAFKQICSIPGLREQLPSKYIAKSLGKRYLWLSEAQKKNKMYLSALVSKLCSLYYKLQVVE